jgi:hypothetical protein
MSYVHTQEPVLDPVWFEDASIPDWSGVEATFVASALVFAFRFVRHFFTKKDARLHRR